jgi:modulator of FtsH protease HflC
MNPLKLIAILIVLVIIALSVFQVDQTQHALRLRFGKVQQSDYGPGLHLKAPLIDNIRYFEKRIQTLDADAEHFLTSEKKNLIVDSFVKWRIIDPVQFFIAMGGNEERANQRLAAVIADGLRSKFGNRTIQEVVSGDRTAIMGEITAEASERAHQFGIEVIDVRVKRIDLPQEVSESVYNRMKAERERFAKELRSRGEASAVRIRADADRQKVELMAQARRDAEIARGQGEAQAAQIYAQAYNKDAEFYTFYRSLNAYRDAFTNKSDVLVIEPNSDFFAYFKQQNLTLQPAPQVLRQSSGQTVMPPQMPNSVPQYHNTPAYVE